MADSTIPMHSFSLTHSHSPARYHSHSVSASVSVSASLSSSPLSLSLSSLPVDLLYSLFPFLSTSELLFLVPLLNRAFRRFSIEFPYRCAFPDRRAIEHRQPICYWNSPDFSSTQFRSIADSFILLHLPRFSAITSLNLSGCLRLTDFCLRFVLSACPLIASLAISRSKFADFAFAGASTSLIRLRAFSASNCENLTDEALKFIGDSIGSAVSFVDLSESADSFSDCGIAHCIRRTVSLVSLNLSDSSELIGSFGSRVRHQAGLKELYLNNCSSLSNLFFDEMLQHNQTNQMQIHSDSHSNSDSANDSAIDSESVSSPLLRSFVSLEVLELSRSLISPRYFSLFVSSFPRLRVLNLSGWRHLGEFDIAPLAGFVCLARLNLARCHSLTDAAIENFLFSSVAASSSLVDLVLSHCPKLSDRSLFAVGLRCSHLGLLDFTGNYLISDSGVYSLSGGCKELTRFHICGCSKINRNSLLTLNENCQVFA